MVLRPNSVIEGRFRVDGLVAMGSQAIVHRGTDLRSGRRVAIKVMRDVDGISDAEARRQFRREHDILAQEGVGLPRAHGFFEIDGRPTMVADWVEGKSLDHEGTNLPVVRAIHLGLAILRVVEGLHERQPPVLVRDLKPSNLIVEGDEVTLIDLSASRFLRGGRDTVPLGTDGYAAPEQYLQHSEVRSDLFAVGVIIYHLLTGEVARMDDLPCNLAARRPDVPRSLHTAISRATQADVAARFPSAEEMARRLRKALREALDEARTSRTAQVVPPSTSAVPVAAPSASASRAAAMSAAVPSRSAPSSSAPPRPSAQPPPAAPPNAPAKKRSGASGRLATSARVRAVDRRACLRCGARNAGFLLVTLGGRRPHHLVFCRRASTRLRMPMASECEVAPRVCARCGAIAMFATRPSIFVPDIGPFKSGGKNVPIDRATCPLCGNRTAACLLVTAGGQNPNHVVEAHSLEKNLLGYSTRASPVEPRVCATCGFVEMFAVAPAQFAPDV